MPIVNSLSLSLSHSYFFFFFIFVRVVLPTLVVVWPSLLSPPQSPMHEGEYQEVIPAHVFCLRCCLCVLYVRECVYDCVFVLASILNIGKSVTARRVWGFYPEVLDQVWPPFFSPHFFFYLTRSIHTSNLPKLTYLNTNFRIT